MFNNIHGHKKHPLHLYKSATFKASEEEQITCDEMAVLLKYADASCPEWGNNMKRWVECEKVILVSVNLVTFEYTLLLVNTIY